MLAKTNIFCLFLLTRKRAIVFLHTTRGENRLYILVMDKFNALQVAIKKLVTRKGR